ncbi:MAG TPA: STAS-like domain-containing protein [Phycisphaerae bacterium]|nr:STAS-like domain-containing protein [Phycisphaerae bacterium]
MSSIAIPGNLALTCWRDSKPGPIFRKPVIPDRSTSRRPHGSIKSISPLARFNPLEEIWLDFNGIDSIGQSFADEIFRVFRCHNPSIKLAWINAPWKWNTRAFLLSPATNSATTEP